MRINIVTPSIVGRPATSTQPREVESARRVGAQTTGVPARPAQPSGAGSNATVANVAVAPEPVVERRQLRRRGNDRRKQQMAVLIDTRLGQRRNSRRRDEDDAPRRVNTRA